MLQVAKYSCQVRNAQDRIITLSKGTVIDYPGKHVHLRPVEGATEKAEKINFLKASEAELKAAKWKFSEANEAMMVAYGKELTKEEGTKKSDIIAQILDIRYRAVGVSDLNRLD